MMADRHKHHPVTVRLAEGDRAWVLAYAEQAGPKGETDTATVRQHLALAFAEYRAKRSGDTTRRGVTTDGDTTSPVAAKSPEPSAGRKAAGQNSSDGKCEHPPGRIIDGQCRACWQYLGEQKGTKR